MATYFDQSFFPYNPQSDIDLYGKAFHKSQPKLPKDLADVYYTRTWQSTQSYGSFAQTRLFLGMLNKFFDRSQDEAQYFSNLSSAEQYTERHRLSQRDGDYFWSSRQTTSNKLGFLDESINPSVYRGDLNADGIVDASDTYYGVGQLIWSLVGRPGADGHHLHQIQRDSIGSMLPTFLSGQRSDAIIQDMLAPLNADGSAGDLLALTESACMAHAQSMANGDQPLADDALYGLAVLLSTSQHVFLQGRRNLFGWANQGFRQWHSSDESESDDTVTTRQTILSTFKPQDQQVFDQQLSGDIDTDPLGAMLYDGSIAIGQPATDYRQQGVVRGTDGQVTTWVFQAQSDSSDDPLVGVSRSADGFVWQYGAYSDGAWIPGDSVSLDSLPTRSKHSIERRLMAWDPMYSFIQQMMDGAVRHIQHQTGDDSHTVAGLYSQSQSAIDALIQSETPAAAADAYHQWLQAFPVATLYRALTLAEGGSDIDFSEYQSVYTIESAGWRQDDEPGIALPNQRQVFVDQGYFYRMDAVLSSQLKADKQLFLNNGVSQSRANAAYNERRRDKQAMKAAQWVRDYKSWRDQQDALLS